MNTVFELQRTADLQSVQQSLMITSVYMIYTFLGTKYLPGKISKGFPDKKGKILEYKINGLTLHLFTIVLYFISYNTIGFRLTFIVYNFWSYFYAANILALIFSIILFITGRNGKFYNPHQQSWTPQWLNDFWFGSTLNPRFIDVDIKMYFYQPSLIGLQLFILAFGEHQYITYATLSWNMLLFQLFWFFYLFTHYVREEFMLSTWDIIAENFGLMLVWGDLVYLPFLYCISGWYICDNPQSDSFSKLSLLLIMHVAFHFLFRNANWQKDDYRRLGDKAKIWGEKPKTIQNKLLISGWWGIGRHLNYTGEILVYFTIALCTGYSSIVAYILPISLWILLTHRSTRDDKKCSIKYGKLWEEYCSIAKFRMIPFIY